MCIYIQELLLFYPVMHDGAFFFLLYTLLFFHKERGLDVWLPRSPAFWLSPLPASKYERNGIND